MGFSSKGVSSKPGWRRLTIKGNESWWALLQRVFDLAAIHGGFDPSKLQAQFGSAVVDGNRNLQLEETVAENDAEPSDEEPEQKEP